MTLRSIIALLSGVAVAVYPIIVYFGLMNFNIQALSVILAILLALRVWTISATTFDKKRMLTMISLCCAAGVAVLGLITNNVLALRFYPVVVTTGFLIVFVYSLVKPPTIIEFFARMITPDLSDTAKKYTQTVTKVWVLFLVCNDLIALYTAMYASIGYWTFYNGFLSYVLMAALFVGEWLTRQHLIKGSQ